MVSYSFWAGDRKRAQRGTSGSVGNVCFFFIRVLVTWIVLFLTIYKTKHLIFHFCGCIFYVNIKLNNGPKLACQYLLRFMDISATRLKKIPGVRPI